MKEDLKQLLNELKSIDFFNNQELCIIGCSTSEVKGSNIGSDGSIDVAKVIYESLDFIHKETGCLLYTSRCV